jgi:hypothetical protein
MCVGRNHRNLAHLRIPPCSPSAGDLVPTGAARAVAVHLLSLREGVTLSAAAHLPHDSVTDPWANCVSASFSTESNPPRRN